ncbi:unnamed protein product [Ceutorhynchus assimilis]|uniref:Uncharacterized protein n=1 Tax=Ceutorhynchus assimilis TaxID=467358 RepID=A0A9N9QAT0_9CUCU|nr:unnamed protein product [Ceutorhynchus assimilis]
MDRKKWDLNDPEQAMDALNYLYSLPENENDSEAEADSEAEEELNDLDDSQLPSSPCTSSSSRSSIYSNLPVTADYEIHQNQENVADDSSNDDSNEDDHTNENGVLQSRLAMSIAEINDKYSFKECNKKEELEIGKPYKIINISKMDTKFGPSILVALEDGKSIFLPKRYDFTQEEIKKLTNGCSALIYRGEKNVGKPLPAAVFEFAEWTM